MVGAVAFLNQGRPRRAALTLRQGVLAYQKFGELTRKVKAPRRPPEMGDFEGMCRQVLEAFEPPVKVGADPVQSLMRVVRRLPRKRRGNPGRVIDALDAVVTAGRSVDDPAVEQRMVRQIARMLGGRVLLHYADEHYVTLDEQSRHTLSTWSLRRILRDRGIVVRKVRRRPEFWRPEQRRPRGLLSFPVRGGIACIQRGTAFGSREARAVRAVLRFWRARSQGAQAPQKPEPIRTQRILPPLAGEGLIGQSKAWRRVLRLVLRVAPSGCSVVLLGETGTGKERLARALHATSHRAHGPFVAINCGTMTGDLLNSELFGHIRGAFTGAIRNHDGAFVRAHRGTLFLDEVADMPSDMQVSILRALEDHSVKPLGSERARAVDVRILCATNKNLQAEVAAGRFREDLFHRLDVVEIRLPPLRERIADIPLLARHLLSRMPERRTLHIDAVRVLAHYPWPGNVRELDNVLRAAALLTDGSEITPETLERILAGRRAAAERRAVPREDAPRHAGLLEALRHEWRSAIDLSRALSISTRTVNRDLARLVTAGVVESFGQARARRYRLARRDSSRLRTEGPTSD